MRVCFFLAMAGSAIAPVTGLAVIHGVPETLSFIGMPSSPFTHAPTPIAERQIEIAPVFPSLISYLTGLVFYTTHIPERWMSEKWCRRLNAFGGGRSLSSSLLVIFLWWSDVDFSLGVGSHCIWHLFIVLAVTQHKTAMASLREGMQCLAS